jgi:serine/threonine protein kinase
VVDTGLYIGPDNAPDRYRLLRSIGRGGEAVLYLAELELSGATEPVVVKVLDARQTLSQELFSKISEKWREQAELLRFVHRLGVVGIREHFEGSSAHPAGAARSGGGRALYLVMNHVEGLDLRDWRAERTLEKPAERREAVRCLEQLADVLDWLHSGTATPSGRTVVHGDLSPGNVMIDANGQATLVDFGLSKLTADHQTAEVWFTPGFAAPEVFEGKRTPATDRYAFGAIAYFLLSGLTPGTMPETLRAALLDLPELAPLDREKAATIAAIFANNPADRPESLAAWVRELRPAVISTTTRAPVLPPVPAIPPPPAHTPGAAPTTADPVAAAGPPAPRNPPVPAYVPPPVHTPPPYTPPVPEAVQEPVAEATAVVRAPARHAPVEPAPTALLPEPEPGPDTRPTVVLGSAGMPPDGDGTGKDKRRSRKPEVVAAFVVALLLVGGGVYAGVALSGGDTKDRAATEAKSSGPVSPIPRTQSPTDGPTTDGTQTTDPSATDTPSDPGTMRPGDTEALTLETPVDMGYWETGTAEVDGKQYYDVLRTTYCDGGYAEYNLGRHWKTFKTTLGVDDNGKDAPVLITVTADGNQLLREQVQLGHPITRDLDISGALRLRVDWAVDGDGECGTGVLADPTLVR